MGKAGPQARTRACNGPRLPIPRPFIATFLVCWFSPPTWDPLLPHSRKHKASDSLLASLCAEINSFPSFTFFCDKSNWTTYLLSGKSCRQCSFHHWPSLGHEPTLKVRGRDLWLELGKKRSSYKRKKNTLNHTEGEGMSQINNSQET